MADIGIINASGDYRVITINANEVQIPLRPTHQWDGAAWVLSDDPLDKIGIISEGGEYREIPYAADEQIVELRPSDNHQWQDDDWVYVEPPRDINAEVANHSLALKVGVVNATRVDGLTDPVTTEGLAAIEERYKRTIDEFTTDIALGDTVSEERKDVVRLIRQGNEFFKLVDVAADTIIAAGDAADPIDTDARWPAIPTPPAE